MSVNLPSAAQHGEMCTSSLSAEQQRDLATRITTFLSMYSHLSDSYIIEFFTEDLWSSLPSSWRAVLRDLKYPQIADLLLGASHADRRYPSVWPLSLLAFRATAQALAFPRESREGGGGGAEEFQNNESQSSLLRHIFRKHVKPKKQHEIRKLGALVKELCDQTDCSSVVDVGSGQGHLTRFLSFGLGLSVTAIEADRALLAMATKFDGELLGVLEKEREKQNESGSSLLPVSQPRHVAGTSSAKRILKTRPPGARVSRRGFDLLGEMLRPDFVLTGLHACGDLSSTLLRHFISCPHVRGITSVACCYMKISTREHPSPPGLIAAPHPAGERLQEAMLQPSEFGYPMSSWVGGLPGHQLSYKAREAACHALEDYRRRLWEESQLLRTHCYRATLETFIREQRPELRRAGVQTVKKAHLLTFTEYARLGLARVSLPPDLPLDGGQVEAMLEQQGRVVVFFSLALLLAPVVETLVLLDRIIYLQENGVDSRLVPLFDPNLSPRNVVLVALKARGHGGAKRKS
ncbi:hypothetical protein CgunFtcFv8_018946 [Champsocephalus gunnari]|uniref:Methyltransferase domain-containing protein n=1 Tax=Champsocephalus gunnari TaxID=52237 RepID=A0AAN8HN85_CHAGU|nr:hypothetical protein CgunFtcFv8_018946 [Champsocephalus gunnari]